MIIEQTEDGIPTLYLPRMDEQYHSIKGALAEARHVYIDSALRASGKKEINVLEIGFGTGVNTFLTFLESQEKGLRINYTTFELYPLSPDITEKLNYPALIAPSSESIFALLHQCEWNQKIAISPLFSLYKRHADLTRNVGRKNFPGDFQSLVSGWYSEHLLCERGNKKKASICRVYGRTVTRPAER